MTIEEAEKIVAKEFGVEPAAAEFEHLPYGGSCSECGAKIRQTEPSFGVLDVGSVCADRIACRKRDAEAGAVEQARFEEEVIAGKIRFAKGD